MLMILLSDYPSKRSDAILYKALEIWNKCLLYLPFLSCPHLSQLPWIPFHSPWFRTHPSYWDQLALIPFLLKLLSFLLYGFRMVLQTPWFNTQKSMSAPPPTLWPHSTSQWSHMDLPWLPRHMPYREASSWTLCPPGHLAMLGGI
jgi:hypothetical protein